MGYMETLERKKYDGLIEFVDIFFIFCRTHTQGLRWGKCDGCCRWHFEFKMFLWLTGSLDILDVT